MHDNEQLIQDKERILTLNSTCFEASAFVVFFICIDTSINIAEQRTITIIVKCLCVQFLHLSVLELRHCPLVTMGNAFRAAVHVTYHLILV